MTESTFLLNGKIELRPDDKGNFDELVTTQGVECAVHFEMMSDDCLWIGLYPKGEDRGDAVHVRVIAKGKKLKIFAEEA